MLIAWQQSGSAPYHRRLRVAIPLGACRPPRQMRLVKARLMSALHFCPSACWVIPVLNNRSLPVQQAGGLGICSTPTPVTASPICEDSCPVLASSWNLSFRLRIHDDLFSSIITWPSYLTMPGRSHLGCNQQSAKVSFVLRGHHD